jgi:predicted nucleotidyltransferase
MMHVKVRYDAKHGTFKLVDKDFKVILEGDALYDLAIPFVFDEADVEEFIPASSTFLAHA